MMKIKNSDGSILNGVYKTELGAIIIDDKKEFNKYKMERERILKMNNMERELHELKSMLAQLLEKNNNSNRD